MSNRDGSKGAPAPGITRRAFGFAARLVWFLAAWISAPLLLIALALRLTVKDDLDGYAILFYATPWPVLTALATICVLYWRRRPRIRWIALTILLGCATMFVIRGFGFAPRSAEPAAFRIAYWNVARPEWRLDKILPQSDRFGAEYFIFGEHREGRVTPQLWHRHFAGRFVLPLARELLLIAPEEVRRVGGGSLGGAGGYQLYRAVIHGREVFLLMVDFTASLQRSRRPAFEPLFQTVDAYAEKPLIVIGDFNTPADSVYFDRLRTRVTNAFETAGRGYAATWPMPLPVLQLDHIWTNKHLRVVRCEHQTSLYSDHRAVVADIAFP